MIKQLRKSIGSKYGNKKTAVFGIEFDSKREAERYLVLKSKLEKGIITNLKRQVKFELIPKQDGERAAAYIADFTYLRDGKTVAEDVKSEATRKDKAYILKRKLFKHKYPNIIFLEVV